MPSFGSEWLMETAVLLPLLIFSLVIHEYAHARTALEFGDHTAHYLGRVTLNPLAHLDPMGTLCLIFIGFGWAKPVPVNPLRLNPRKWGNIAVSMAGVASNLLMAIVAALLLRAWWTFGPAENQKAFTFVYMCLLRLASINLVLCTFNLLPLFPLDGHHVVRELLPANKQGPFMAWQMRFGMIALMALLFAPRLLSHLTRRSDIPDPLGWMLVSVRSLLLKALGIL